MSHKTYQAFGKQETIGEWNNAVSEIVGFPISRHALRHKYLIFQGKGIDEPFEAAIKATIKRLKSQKKAPPHK